MEYSSLWIHEIEFIGTDKNDDKEMLFQMQYISSKFQVKTRP